VTTRVLHVVAPFDRRDGICRAVDALAEHLPGVRSELCTSRVLAAGSAFEDVHELGGSDALFHISRRREIARTVERTRADIVHLHGGIWTSLLGMSSASQVPVVHSVYAWPRAPSLRTIARSSWREMRSSAVLPNRVLLSTLIPRWAVRRALERRRVAGVLTQDPRVAADLGPVERTRVRLMGGGGEVDELRAAFDAERPTIVIAGKAETARGIDTLLAAFPEVLAAIPSARLRMLLLPGSQLPAIRRSVASSGFAESIEIATEPSADLRHAFARCTLGAFPFKYDGTTAAPPLTVVEAMSVGLPIVGTPVACLRPILRPRENGLLVPIDDPASLGSAIRTVLTDHGTWLDLSDGAVASVQERWSWSDAAATTAGLYREVLAR